MHPHPPSKAKVGDRHNSLRRHNVKFPGQGEKLKQPEEKKTVKKKVASKSQNDREAIALSKISADSSIERGYQRSDSFSKYKPLPSISSIRKQSSHELPVRIQNSDAVKQTNKKIMRKSATSNKRVVFPNGTLEENTSPHNISDDTVLKSMKKMKLTLDQKGSRTTRSSRSATSSNTSPMTSSYPINLIIRTLTGDKIQHTFSSNNTVLDIFKYLSQCLRTNINNGQHVLYTSEVPKRLLDVFDVSLEQSGIKDRTVLLLDIR